MRSGSHTFGCTPVRSPRATTLPQARTLTSSTYIHVRGPAEMLSLYTSK